MNERNLLAEADRRALAYLDSLDGRRVFPDAQALAALATFDQSLPEDGGDAEQVLRQLDEIGSPATVASNAARYFGFVIGATLPVAAAAERLVLAWDQCASSFDNSPVADRLEKIADAGSAKRWGYRIRAQWALAPVQPPAPWPVFALHGARYWPARAGISMVTDCSAHRRSASYLQKRRTSR
jgi:hypothetical protein